MCFPCWSALFYQEPARTADQCCLRCSRRLSVERYSRRSRWSFPAIGSARRVSVGKLAPSCETPPLEYQDRSRSILESRPDPPQSLSCWTCSLDFSANIRQTFYFYFISFFSSIWQLSDKRFIFISFYFFLIYLTIKRQRQFYLYFTCIFEKRFIFIFILFHSSHLFDS